MDKECQRPTESRQQISAVMMSTSCWNGMAYQHHHLARQFAAKGIPVHFIERTPKRWPRVGIADLRAWLRGSGYGSDAIINTKPGNLTVLTPRWLPPARILRPLNRMLIRRAARMLPRGSAAVFVTYTPTFNTLDLIAELKPRLTAYVCDHNYDADKVMGDVLRAERQLIESADLLYADSRFLQDRLRRISGREVFACPPGVDLAAFKTAFRGDELERRQTLYYFGGIGVHLDLDLYAGLARKGVRVVFVGVVSPEVKNMLPAEIEVRPPVPNAELPVALKDADMFMIAYKHSPYIRAVLPAKFFECLGTRKPLLVSGWAEAAPYAGCVYDVGGSVGRAFSAISDLASLHTTERQARQQEVAADADWTNRFAQFYRHIQDRLDSCEIDDG